MYYFVFLVSIKVHKKNCTALSIGNLIYIIPSPKE